MRYALHRLWNPRTEKGLLGTLRKGSAVKLVADLLRDSERFFTEVEEVCETKVSEQASERRRAWTELRVRQPDLVPDTLTLPVQRLREAVGDLVKLCNDKDTAQELIECNRRLDELREGLAVFLGQRSENYVHWVERSGKTHKNLSLHAAPIDVAEFLHARLFEADTSVILTSATLSISASPSSSKSSESTAVARQGGLNYCAKRVGATDAQKLQVGSPFDYERQMKLFVVSKIPDPRRTATTRRCAIGSSISSS